MKSIGLEEKTLVRKQKKQVGVANRVGDGAPQVVESSFAEVVGMIDQSRQKALRAINTELVGLYWAIGRYISVKLAAAEWGESVVGQLAEHIARTMPNQRGFTSRNLFRMRQFFETYDGEEKVTPLVSQIPWTHNLIIMTQSSRPEQREFYLRMACEQRWSKRELERQFRLAAFETAVTAPAKLSPVVTQLHGEAAASIFKDNYTLEFLGLPSNHTEADLHQGLLGQLQAFLIELGRDFCFVGFNHPLQVGKQGFSLDLLLFTRPELP